MSKVLTYNWQSQPYISWKGDLTQNQFNVAVPVEKRPVAKAVATMGNSKSSSHFGPSQQSTSTPAVQVGRNSRVGGYSYDASGVRTIMGGVGARARHFGPQPLKHWRRQLNPDNKSGNSKASVANLMDRPGGSVNLNSSIPLSGCLGCNNETATDISPASGIYTGKWDADLPPGLDIKRVWDVNIQSFTTMEWAQQSGLDNPSNCIMGECLSLRWRKNYLITGGATARRFGRRLAVTLRKYGTTWCRRRLV